MKEKNNRPEMVYVEVKNLKLNPNNPRKNDESVATVMLSIQKYGFKNPLICNTDYVVYCGNTRLKAARKLKLKEVPCIVADDLSPEEIREFAIVDNKSNEIAEWDMDLLKTELADLDFSDFPDIDFGVFDETEEKEIIEDDNLFDDIEKEETHYGVPYQGNKSRIADIILEILPSGKRLVDLFGGGVYHSLRLIKKQVGELFI